MDRLATYLWLSLFLAAVYSAAAQEMESPSPASAVSPNDESEAEVTSIYPDIPQFGGPSSVGGQLAEDASIAPQFRLQGLQDHFQPWFDFKSRVNEHSGLQFNIDESIFYQVATDSLGENDAASVTQDNTLIGTSVLANDSDPEGNGFTAQLVGSTTNGRGTYGIDNN